MNKINILKVISSVIVIGLLSACSSKDGNASYNPNINEINTKQEIESKIDNTVDQNVDERLSQIQSIQTRDLSNDTSKIGSRSYYNTVTSYINGKTVTLTSIHFGFGMYRMNDEMSSINSENSTLISPIINENRHTRVKLEGNCDEWGNDEFNFALGLKRAKTVKDSLINTGINASNIVVVSLGESNPICTDQTASCWKKNRRVDHRFIP